MLSTAEMTLGLFRHLSTYGSSQPKADLAALEYCGRALEVAVCLQGSGVMAVARAEGIASAAGISRRDLHRELLPTLDHLGWVHLERDAQGQITIVSEQVPPLAEVFASADRLLSIISPDPIERMALAVLDATTRMPITVETATDIATRIGTEQGATRAIEDLESLHLCVRQRTDDGTTVLFNPNVWAADRDYSQAALRAEDGPVYSALSGLIEEVAATAGLPESDVTSTEQRWIDYAVAQGLLLRSLVKTSTGAQQAFLFAPHMGRSAFNAPTGIDPSGHVRQLIGSMVFARRFASNRLFAPRAFLNRLLREGEAGDASNIGTDYSMLETSGIVRVDRANRYYKFVLLKPNIAEGAIDYLDNTGTSGTTSGGLRDQRTFVYPESERARMQTPGKHAEPSTGATSAILAALRQEAGRRRYG